MSLFRYDPKKMKERSDNLDEREKKILSRCMAGVHWLYYLILIPVTLGMLYAAVNTEVPVFYLIVFWLFIWMFLMIGRAILMSFTLALTIWFARN